MSTPQSSHLLLFGGLSAAVIGVLDIAWYKMRHRHQNLSHLLCCLCVCVQYEPELFPGLIYRMKEPKIVLLIFVSGKVVLTGRQPQTPLIIHCCVPAVVLEPVDQVHAMPPYRGHPFGPPMHCQEVLSGVHVGLSVAGAKKRDEIYQAFENIYPTLCEFRKREATDAAGLTPLLTAPAAAATPSDQGKEKAAGSSAAAAATPAGPSQAAAGGPGGVMMPPPARRTNSMAPPAATPAAEIGHGAPAATPAGNIPPPTPQWQPAQTPVSTLTAPC